MTLKSEATSLDKCVWLLEASSTLSVRVDGVGEHSSDKNQDSYE